MLFHSVLDEALERLGKKNLKLNECQYEAIMQESILSLPIPPPGTLPGTCKQFLRGGRRL